MAFLRSCYEGTKKLLLRQGVGGGVEIATFGVVFSDMC